MKMIRSRALKTALALLLTATPACADWCDVWGEVEDLGQKARKLGEQAWEMAKEEWAALDINHELLQAFGGVVDEQSALIGRFYDLKRPIDDRAKPLSRQGVVDLLHRFNKEKWDQDFFSAYYSPKIRLYAPYFYLPRCKAAYGPEAFQCNSTTGEGAHQVEPTAWVVVYRGMVTAPRSGTFRFVGMGDDTLMVRFNNRLVLESGWSIPTRRYYDEGTHRSYQLDISRKPTSFNSRHQREITPKTCGRAIYQYNSTPHWNERLGGLPSGVPFTVKQGEKYPIEILVSEIPGSEFGFCLLVEELKSPARAPYGIIPADQSPVLHLFRTADTLPDPRRMKRALTNTDEDYSINDCEEGPPFREDSLIWQVDFDEADKRGLFDRIFGDDTAMGSRHERDDD